MAIIMVVIMDVTQGTVDITGITENTIEDITEGHIDIDTMDIAMDDTMDDTMDIVIDIDGMGIIGIIAHTMATVTRTTITAI